MYSSIYRSPSTKTFGSSFSEEEVRAVWNKGKTVFGKDPSIWRKDVCGAWIRYDAYGKTSSEHGWEIDHIMPVSTGGSDSLFNLQPLQWENNRHKSDSISADYCKIVARA